MFLESPLHVSNNVLYVILKWASNVASKFVDLVQSRVASFLQSMFDVVECLVNLSAKVFGILFGSAILSTCLY
jgi:hypothetical protein